MLRVTYLGHHGWLIESAGSALLVDPVLEDGIGNMPWHTMSIWPPRRISLEAWPRLDAVVLTHEHPDHFSLGTLLRIDRRVPVLVSGRASVAVARTLSALGFACRSLQPRRALVVGELSVTAFAARAVLDEWDVMPLVICGPDGSSFVTHVDAPDDGSVEGLRPHVPKTAAWVYAHNYMDLFALRMGGRPVGTARATDDVARGLVSRFKEQFVGPRALPAPGSALVLSGGMVLPPPLDVLNPHIFPADNAAVVARLRAAFPGQRFVDPLPGDAERFDAGLWVEAGPRPELLAPLAPEAWPVRGGADPAGPLPDVGPACGRTALRDGERAELDQLLARLAGDLYGGPLFRRLYALGADEVAPRRPVFALHLRDDGGSIACEYAPSACAFVPVDDDVRQSCAAGFEAWASDVLEVLRGDLVPSYVAIGRIRTWSTPPLDVFEETLLVLLHHGHPLRRPDDATRLYERTLAALGPRPIVLHAS
jgi:hypothetical protein